MFSWWRFSLRLSLYFSLPFRVFFHVRFTHLIQWCTLWLFFNSTSHLQILGGPIGRITFTALSKTSINIQIDKGKNVGLFQRFTIRRTNWKDACYLPIYATLNDCTDRHARQGKNHYRIGARYATAGWTPSNYYTNTLHQDRMFCRISIWWFAF